MSRSYKKNLIIKDYNRGSKQAAHRVTRSTLRNILNSKIDYEDMIFPTAKANELVNQYDICDWKNSYNPKPFIWYNSKLGKLVAEYPTKADFRMYKNK